jgi:hypothetical protein
LSGSAVSEIAIPVAILAITERVFPAMAAFEMAASSVKVSRGLDL